MYASIRIAVAVLALILGTSLAAAVPALAQQTSFSSAAPADEYFGRFKLSILGIRNYLKDLNARADAEPNPAPIMGRAMLVEDALRDWAEKYPRDSWIPRMSHSLAQLYGKLASDGAHERGRRMTQWLAVHYPASEFARTP